MTILRIREGLPKRVALYKSVFVPDDVRAFDWGKDSDFVEGILLLFVGEIGHFDFLESIDLRIDDSLDFVDARVGSFSELADNDEIFEGHRD